MILIKIFKDNSFICLEKNMYISKVKLTNFKKFKESSFEFNDGKNIIIGKNDSGKSTILQAIDIALNQKGNGDRYNSKQYGTLLNAFIVNDFFNKKDVENNLLNPTKLPSIEVEIFIDNLNNGINQAFFYGSCNSEKKDKYGITFKYSFNDDFKKDCKNLFNSFKSIDDCFIPFEFYSAEWTTFAGRYYNFRRNPFKSILVDNSKSQGDAYNDFLKEKLNAISLEKRNTLSINLKKAINNFNNQSNIDEFKIDTNRIHAKDYLDIVDTHDTNKKIFMRDAGSGQENIIKTKLALSESETKLILLEEPENHLAFDSSRKQIDSIARNNKTDQMIISTHSPLLVNKIGINNIKWITDSQKFKSFKDMDENTSNFFQKLDNINILQIIVAKKVILVEGATEYICMEDMVKSVTQNTLEKLGVHVLSMGGNYFKYFKELSKIVGNKILVITDNDGSDDKIQKAKEINNKARNNFQVKMPRDTSSFTFEVDLYNSNSNGNNSILNNIVQHNSTKSRWNNHDGLDKTLVWMLNNKTEAAMEYSSHFTSNDESIEVPTYIREGIEWLVK